MPKIFFIFLCLIVLLLPQKVTADIKKIETLIFGWQMEEASEFIKSIDNPPEYLKGLYEFYSGNYITARQHFRNIQQQDNIWLDIIDGIMPVIENFQQLETKYFMVRYTGKDRAVALYLKSVLDGCVEKLYEKFGWKPGEKVILEIYPDRKSFQAASTLTDKHIKVSGAIGICKFNRLMLASPRILKFGYRWMNTATHEYVHYIIGKITGLRNVPLWFNEGMAKYMEEIWKKEKSEADPVDINYLIKARKTGQWVEFEKMKYGMPTLDTRDEVALAFAQVQSIIDFLILKYGINKISKLIRILKIKTADEAFVDIYGKSIPEIQLEWEEYLNGIELKATPGASGPSYAFNEDPVNAISEWVSETALTDIKIGDRFRKNGRNNLALRKYRHALKKDPGNAVILNKLAKIYALTGDIEKAKDSFLRAMKSNPSYAPPYLHIGKLLFNEKKYPQAEKYILEYIYRSPFNPESHNILLSIYSRIGEKRKAERESQILDILSEKDEF